MDGRAYLVQREGEFHDRWGFIEFKGYRFHLTTKAVDEMMEKHHTAIGVLAKDKIATYLVRFLDSDEVLDHASHEY